MTLAISLGIALLEFVLITVIFWYFGPDIEYGIFYWLNKRVKGLRNTPTKILHTRYSDILHDILLDEHFFDRFNELAISKSILWELKGNDIHILNFKYGKSNYSGMINFSFHDYTTKEISRITLSFDKLCHYNQFEEQIFSLVETTKCLESLILPLFPEYISFINELECKLSNLDMITKVFKVLNKVSDNDVFSYIYLKDSMFIEIDDDSIVLRNEIDENGIALLKEMVTMYQ